jgi:hypothetical protein
VSAVDTSRPDTIARRPQFRTHRGHCRRSAGCGSTPCGGHPGLDSHPRPGSAAAADTVCGGWPPLPPPAGRAWTVDRRRSPCPCPAQGRCGGVRGGSRPPGQQLAAIPDVQRTPRRCPVPPADAPGFRPGRRSRQTSAVQTCDRRRSLRTLAARRRPALWTPARLRQGHADTAAAAGWTAGSRTVQCRLHVRPGTGPQGAASASTAMARPPDPWAGAQRPRRVLECCWRCSGQGPSPASTRYSIW